MTPARFRKFVLGLEGVTEVPHMERQAFRTTRRIFCTIGGNKTVNLLISPADKREGLMESFPEVFHSLGGWSKLGYVGVDLEKADEGLLRELVLEAHEAALPEVKETAAAAGKVAAAAKAKPAKKR